ncbi:bifunctional serine/threonine-protein kinase/formylglycine-generating enzyme family protein [Azospirillum sp. HJ39]|uniref:bifunctional serine/threonine-protein kinase/formylglycine-generating enzyme family protein n=1 Tax=Azospirillum sp. HJ39 TaxID=3159496 RepID=UPI0035579FAC
MVNVGKLSGSKIGSYHLGALLGQGGFGAVYRAEVVVGDRVIAKPVAVKVIDPVKLDTKEPVRELENAAALRHPHLVEVLGHPGEVEVRDADGRSGRVYWFAMELGTETLHTRLTRGPLSEAETRTLLRQIGAALAWLHERDLVHRDVKPSNILKVGEVWKLGDLGLTRRTVEGYYAQLKGTTLYLSPESLDDPAPKASWDAWALGMTALEAVVGAHPWRNLTERKLYVLLGGDEPLPLPSLPAGVEAAIQGCLDKEPGRRWTTRRLVDANGAVETGASPPSPHHMKAEAPVTPWRVHAGIWMRPGCVFQDAEIAPRMVVLPRGGFWMGMPESERSYLGDDAIPYHYVNIDYNIAMGECAVTFAEWDAFVSDGGPERDDSGWGRGDMPVINISKSDAQHYLDWLNDRLGMMESSYRYRLPSEAEWEYSSRSGTNTKYWWGNRLDTNLLNISGSMSERKTVSVRRYAPNYFGLYQTLGNIGEWCEDVWHDFYYGAPIDGSAWMVPDESTDGFGVYRGGAYCFDHSVDSAYRFQEHPDTGSNGGFEVCGFRVARTLPS